MRRTLTRWVVAAHALLALAAPARAADPAAGLPERLRVLVPSDEMQYLNEEALTLIAQARRE